jgi:hypothetical protein
MRKITSEDIFVLVVFGLILAVLTIEPTTTSNVVAQDQASENLQRVPVVLKATEGEVQTHEVDIAKGLSFDIPELQAGDRVLILIKGNSYSMTALRVTQDYSNSLESVSLLIEPGSKRIFLKERETGIIDFNNDGVDDISVTVESVAYGKAMLRILGI